MWRVLWMAVVSLSLAACGPGYLDVDKKVPATEVNRAVFDVLKRYQLAVENKDGETLKTLVSERYHENAGTTDDATDDYGYDKLMQKLANLSDKVKKLQLKLKVLDIQVDGNLAYADYGFVGRMLISDGAVESMRTQDDFNRMQLAREQGQWKILGGL